MKKKKYDENEYLNWYYNPASGRWVRYIPRKPQINQKKVYTQEMLIRDLQSTFCKGRRA